MSIFSWILTIPQFIEKLVASIRKDYLNLEAPAKALIDNAIKFGNILKGYIENPGTAGPVVGDLIVLAENILGTGLVSAIEAILSEVLIDCGIISTAFADPQQAWQALLNHLAAFKGHALGKEIFKIVTTIAEKLTGIADNNELMAIIAVAYKLFFSTAAPLVIPAPAISPTVTPAATIEAQAPPQTS